VTTGTAEERHEKRRVRRARQGQINRRAQFTADIQPGTLDMFNHMRKQNKMSADALLSKLIHIGHRYGI